MSYPTCTEMGAIPVGSPERLGASGAGSGAGVTELERTLHAERCCHASDSPVASPAVQAQI